MKRARRPVLTGCRYVITATDRSTVSTFDCPDLPAAMRLRGTLLRRSTAVTMRRATP